MQYQDDSFQNSYENNMLKLGIEYYKSLFSNTVYIIYSII